MPPPIVSNTDRWTLSYKPVNTQPEPLPKGIERIFIDSPGGKLEILSAVPKPDAIYHSKPPIFFQHGGFGCAQVWLDFLNFFAAKGYPSYALSIRGHGNSYKPGYWTLSFMTTFDVLVHDVILGVEYVHSKHRNDVPMRQGEGRPVIVAHSNGGSLTQRMLSECHVKCAGLVLLAATPTFGGFEIHNNWAMADVWFLPRLYLRDWGHPRSPLSSTSLVHKIFFSKEYPTHLVALFEQYMAEYEALLWPMACMFRYVTTRTILSSLVGSDGGRVLLIAGEKDILVTPSLIARAAEDYRVERRKLVAEGVLKRVNSDEQNVNNTDVGGSGDKDIGSMDGIEFKIIPKSGHHVQNDLQWEEAAQLIYDWLERL